MIIFTFILGIMLGGFLGEQGYIKSKPHIVVLQEGNELIIDINGHIVEDR